MSTEQSRYQVRFDWGTAGADATAADADVIVWTDALGSAPVPLDELGATAAVVRADFATAGAAAHWVVDLQQRLGRRIAIAVIAAGEPRDDGSQRDAVEDLLAAGAVIDRLAARGLDATSPEAAAAEGAFLHLARAVGHLASASVTAMSLAERPAPAVFVVDATLTATDALVARPHPDDAA